MVLNGRHVVHIKNISVNSGRSCFIFQIASSLYFKDNLQLFKKGDMP